MAEGALRELLAYFTVEVDDHELKEFDKGITGAIEKLQGLGKGFAEFLALREAKEFAEHTIEQAAHLEDLALKLDVGTDELQKFQFAASLHGVDDGSAVLGRLSRNIGEAASGSGEAGKEFAKLGIKLKNADGTTRETLDVIDDLSDAFADMKDGPERSAAAMKFFGRQGLALIPLLQGGSEELHKVYTEFEGLGGMMSEDFIHQAHDADDEIKKLDVTFQGLRVRVVNAVLPSIIQLVAGMKNFVIGAQKVIDKSHGIQHAFEFLKILAVVAAIWKLVGVLKSVAAAETLVDALNPFMLAAAGIAALFLAYDDLKTALEGGKSVFKDAFGVEGVNALREALRSTKVVLQGLYDLAKVFADEITIGYQELKYIVTFGDSAKELHAAADKASADVDTMVTNIRQGVGLDDLPKSKTFMYAGKEYPRGKITGGPVIEGQEYTNPEGPDGTWNMEAEGYIKAALAKQPMPNITVTQHNTLKVQVDHKSTDSPDVVGKAIGVGAQKELDKAMLNSLNALKTQ